MEKIIEYEEPSDINYVIVRTTKRKLNERNGNLYQASRKAWVLNFDRVKNINYVLASMGGIVKEVYEIDNWYRSEEPKRVEFNGHEAPDSIRALFVNKKLPSIYSRSRNPVLYKRQDKHS